MCTTFFFTFKASMKTPLKVRNLQSTFIVRVNNKEQVKCGKLYVFYCNRNKQVLKWGLPSGMQKPEGMTEGIAF